MGYTSVICAFAPDAEQRYAEYYGTIDPRRELLYAKGDAGWLQCHDHFDKLFVSRREFYNEFLIPVGARYPSVLHMAGTVMTPERCWWWATRMQPAR